MDNAVYKIDSLLHVVESQGIINKVSNAFCNFTGYGREELLGKPVEVVWRDMLRINADCKFTNEAVETYLFTKTLEARHIVIKSDYIKEEGCVHYNFNVAPFSRVEDKLGLAIKLLDDNIYGVGIYKAPELVLLKANTKYLENLGENFNNKENAYGLCVQEMVKGFEGSPAERLWLDVIEKNQTLYLKRIKGFFEGFSDKYWDMTVIPVSENGRVKYLVPILYDVTERVEKEREILRSWEQMKTIIENISDAFMIIDSEGYYVAMNAAARKLYPELAIGKTIKDAQNSFEYYDLDCNLILYEDLPTRRALRGEQVKDTVLIMVHSGVEEIVEINATPIYDKDNNLVLVSAFYRDITEKRLNQELIKIQQEQMLEAEKEKNQALLKAMEMKNDFLSLISHEFKTPITVIDSAIQTMELVCRDTLPDKARKYIGKIKQNTYRQLRLVNNLLDISRMNAGYLKINKRNIDIVFLTKAIIDSVQIYAQQKKIVIDIVSSLENKIIGVDEEKFERVLLNLLSNAIKFTPQGGGITVKLGSKRGFVSVAVKDTGVGIPEDKHKIIFERFGQAETTLTRQAEGTGIGLSLVKLMVEAMGGSVSVKSREGAGSTFTVLLPEARVETPDNLLPELADSRLIQTAAIEFWDIYTENS